jgi:hypothetical protein
MVAEYGLRQLGEGQNGLTRNVTAQIALLMVYRRLRGVRFGFWRCFPLQDPRYLHYQSWRLRAALETQAGQLNCE